MIHINHAIVKNHIYQNQNLKAYTFMVLEQEKRYLHEHTKLGSTLTLRIFLVGSYPLRMRLATKSLIRKHCQSQPKFFELFSSYHTLTLFRQTIGVSNILIEDMGSSIEAPLRDSEIPIALKSFSTLKAPVLMASTLN